MKNKIIKGIIIGSIAGIIDIIPMIIQHMKWMANLSAFTHWTIVGFFIATTQIPLKGAIKGMVIALILLIPIAILVWPFDTHSILPMLTSTIVLGAISGYFIDKP